MEPLQVSVISPPTSSPSHIQMIYIQPCRIKLQVCSPLSLFFLHLNHHFPPFLLKIWAFLLNMEMTWDRLPFSWWLPENCLYSRQMPAGKEGRSEQRLPKVKGQAHATYTPMNWYFEEGIVYVRETYHFLSDPLSWREQMGLWNPSYSSWNPQQGLGVGQ